MPGSRASRRPRRWLPRLAGATGLVLLLPLSAPGQTAGDENEFRLEQNFPNPFTPGVSPTIITYQLPVEAHVRLTIYNLLAQEVAVLVDRVEPAGRHRVAWDGTDANEEPVPAGVYWYKLQAGDQTALRRLLVQLPAETGSAPPPGPLAHQSATSISR